MDVDYIWHTSLIGNYDGIIIPGGFAYGDRLRAGAIAAHSPIMNKIIDMAEKNVPILGICNGFQILVESGLLPGALTINDSLKFVCKWINTLIVNNKTPFTCLFEDKQKLSIPIAHGEGKFVADRGFGRLVSKEEAKKILDEAEEAGLIHVSSNMTEYIDFICNCCICHCKVIQSMKEQARYISGVSNFIVDLDEESCVGCEICVDRCPMDAFSMNDDDIAEVSKEACVGCGLCVSTCDAGALKMVSRSEKVTPPPTRGKLMEAIVASIK